MHPPIRDVVPIHVPSRHPATLSPPYTLTLLSLFPRPPAHPAPQVKMLPQSLEAATARMMAADSVAREADVFGDAFVEHFGGTREHEVKLWNEAVTNWEGALPPASLLPASPRLLPPSFLPLPSFPICLYPPICAHAVPVSVERYLELA